MTDDHKVLRVGISYPPSSLHDPTAMDLSTVLVTSPCYETPCELGEQDDVVHPALFAGPLQRRADRVWVAPCIPDLKLSNGEPLSATDLAEHLASSSALRDVTVSVNGDEFVFETSQPEARFAHRLINRSTLVAMRRGDRFVGTGPFRIVDGDSRRIRLERNPHHRHDLPTPEDGAAAPETIEFAVLPRNADGSAAALIEGLRAKSIDFTMDLTRDEVEQVQGVRRTFRPGDSTCLLSFNTQGAFAALELRQAAAMALDRHVLAELCYQNPVAYVARGVLPPQLARVGDGLQHDLAAAKSRVAGHAPGRPLRMLRVWAPRPYIPRPAAVALEVKAQLAEIGLEVVDEPATDPEDYYLRLMRADYDLVLGGWLADTGNPAEFLYAVLHSSMVPSPQQAAATACNMARIEDAELDALLEAYSLDGDHDRLVAAQARVDELRPLVPLMYGPSVAVHGWRVQGLAWKDRRLPNLATVMLSDL